MTNKPIYDNRNLRFSFYLKIRISGKVSITKAKSVIQSDANVSKVSDIKWRLFFFVQAHKHWLVRQTNGKVAKSSKNSFLLERRKEEEGRKEIGEHGLKALALFFFTFSTPFSTALLNLRHIYSFLLFHTSRFDQYSLFGHQIFKL